MTTKVIRDKTLAPCPFCGDTPVMRKGKTLHIDCATCDLVMWGKSPASLATKWNTNYETTSSAATPVSVGACGTTRRLGPCA